MWTSSHNLCMMPPMPKEQSISIRIDDATKAALTKLAEDDKRSLSSLVQKIIADWLKRRGKR
jgi:predicted transcriptional regulator